MPKQKRPLRAIHSEEGRKKIEKDILEEARSNEGLDKPLSLRGHLEANPLVFLGTLPKTCSYYLPTLFRHITLTDNFKRDAIYLAENYKSPEPGKKPQVPEKMVRLFLSNNDLAREMLIANPALFSLLKKPSQEYHYRNMLQEIERLHTLGESTDHLENALFNIPKDIQPKLQSIRESFLTATAAASYQEYLYSTALTQCQFGKIPYRFDVQGHLCTEVDLSRQQYLEIIAKIAARTNQTTEDMVNQAKEDPKLFLETLLGEKISNITHCNIDISHHDFFKNQFKEWLTKDAASEEQPLLGSLVDKLFAKETATSNAITPLQAEAEAHMRLGSRVLENVSNDKGYSEQITPQHWERIRTLATKKINEKLKIIFRNALLEAHEDGELNYAKLNGILDTARKNVYQKICEESLMQACHETMTATMTEKEWEKWAEAITSVPKQKHLFEQTTASGNNQFYTSNQSNIAKLISPTNNTAHNKTVGKETQALRHITRVAFKPNPEAPNTMRANPNIKFQFRVPSISPKKDAYGSKISKDDAITDCRLKITETSAKLKKLGYEGPFSYLLLTSLYYTKKGDSNKQTQSAERILVGAHQYNRSLEGDTNFCFIQNIPVNKHGVNLGHGLHKNDTTQEATLMAELALLSTLNQNSSHCSPDMRKEIRETYQAVLKEYKTFLKDSHSNPNALFKNSAQGKRAITLIKSFKNECAHCKDLMPTAKIPPTKESFVESATLTLLKLMAKDKHLDLEHGKLIQSLSDFLAIANQSGCKSANERFQAVTGRSEMLMGIGARLENNEPLSEKEKVLVQCLTDYSQGKITTQALHRSVTEVYNDHLNANGAFSHEDQGAAAKLKNFANAVQKFFMFWHTDYGEKGRLTNLSTNKAGGGQAHKGEQYEYIKKAAKTVCDDLKGRTRGDAVDMTKIYKARLTALKQEKELPGDDTLPQSLDVHH